MTRTLLRPATLADASLLLSWVNDVSSLQWKQNTKSKIKPKEHENWLCSRLDDPTCRLWIICDAQQRPVGQIRLERRYEDVLIDIFICPDIRGRGIASFALNAAINYYSDEFGTHKFCAVVHEDNNASLKLFERHGFALENSSGKPWVILRRTSQK